MRRLVHAHHPPVVPAAQGPHLVDEGVDVAEHRGGGRQDDAAVDHLLLASEQGRHLRPRAPRELREDAPAHTAPGVKATREGEGGGPARA